MKKLTTTVFFILICAFLFAGNDSRVLLQEVKNKLERVNDYSVNILIKIDVDFLKVDNYVQSIGRLQFELMVRRRNQTLV